MYRKIYTALVVLTLTTFLFTQNGFCVTQWNKGAPASTDLKSIWPATSQANNSILDSLLQNYKRGLYLNYSSASALAIGTGEIVVSNSTGSIRLFLVATGATTITSSNLDTGSITASTTYYVYAGTSTATDSAPTYYISLSASAPSGVTYYAQLGSFTTDSSSQFGQIVNNNVHTYVQPPVSKSPNVQYQALTDVFVGTTFTTGSSPFNCNILMGPLSGLIGNISGCGNGNTGIINEYACGWIIPKGYYYECSCSGGTPGCNVTAISN